MNDSQPLQSQSPRFRTTAVLNTPSTTPIATPTNRFDLSGLDRMFYGTEGVERAEEHILGFRRGILSVQHQTQVPQVIGHMHSKLAHEARAWWDDPTTWTSQGLSNTVPEDIETAWKVRWLDPTHTKPIPHERSVAYMSYKLDASQLRHRVEETGGCYTYFRKTFAAEKKKLGVAAGETSISVIKRAAEELPEPLNGLVLKAKPKDWDQWLRAVNGITDEDLDSAQKTLHGSVTFKTNISVREKRQVLQYIDNVDPANVEQVYGVGSYKPWHGDGKSQSRTDITFQTKSMKTSGQPTEYVTIVAKKGTPAAYVTYRSTTWDSAATVIAAMKDGLA